MRNILISTAGTSLLGNIERDGQGDLKKFKAAENIKGVCAELLKYDQTSRICGAEINTVASMVSKQMLAGRFYHLILVSDTDDGRLVGRVLEQFFLSKNAGIGFEKAEYRVVEGLNSEDAARFQKQGLKNLVRIIGETVRAYGSEQILINATGGYKAQISFAGMIGQALDIPVCYMFERFAEVIELPPQPVSLDLGFWIENAAFFYELDRTLMSDGPLELMDEKFSMLVDEVDDNGVYLYGLTAAGQLFHETFRHRFRRRQKELLPGDSDIDKSRKKIKYEDSNAGKHKGLSAWLEKLKDISFVNSIYTFYYNPDLNQQNTFNPDQKNQVDTIEGCFSNNKGTTRFILRTTAGTASERDAAIALLNETFL